MSSPLENIEENKEEQRNEEGVDDQNLSDSEEVPEDTGTPASNTAKQDVNAWRKRRSIAFQRSPFMHRRMSRGEHFFTLFPFCPFPFAKRVFIWSYDPIICKRSISINDCPIRYELTREKISLRPFLACRDRLVRTPTVIVCKWYSIWLPSTHVSAYYRRCAAYQHVAKSVVRLSTLIVARATTILLILDVHFKKIGSLFALDWHQNERYFSSVSYVCQQN